MRFATLILAALLFPLETRGGDWPLWRHDARRTAASPDGLPERLDRHWVRELPRLEPAWPDQPTLQFDAAYEPIVAGRRLFVGSSHDGSVTAYDTRTGDEVWRFFTDGPVRFSPLAWRERLYFVSDDGCLYCLRAGDGTLLWKFRGGPLDRKLLGNGRLISAWPARGAPVVVEGTVYFAAGVWPFMGIFLHALDADTGEVRWTRDGDGSLYIKQPHNTDSFAGVAPQGPLVAIGERLLVPGGRSVPACYDRATGKMLYYQLGQNGKKGGGATVVAEGDLFFNGGGAFELKTEKHLGAVGEMVVVSESVLYDARKLELRALDLTSVPADDVAIAEISEPALASAASNASSNSTTVDPAPWIRELGKAETPKLTALIKAGDRLYAGCEGRILSIALPLPRKGSPNVVWQAEIEGTPASLIAADDRLFAVTTQGSLQCFGPAELTTPALIKVRRREVPNKPLVVDAASSDKADEILKATEVRDGYCLVTGAGKGDLACELVRRTALRIAVIEPDPAIATTLRDRLRASGLGGDRIAVIVNDPLQIPLPPYMASLLIAESLPAEPAARAAAVARLFASLRPFGGVAVLPFSADQTEAITAQVKSGALAGAVWKPAGESTLLIREGALPGSADWSHEHADAANTRVSKDRLVKAPLGLLWFGGSSNEPILPRHGHGPQPQVVDGRAIVEGVDMLRAMDIYTGRILWEAKIPGIGALYDNTAHQPGANASGTNYIATREGIYVVIGATCLKLDPASGQRLTEFRLPERFGQNTAPLWGYLNVSDEFLIGGADPVFDPSQMKTLKKSNVPGGSDDDEPKKKSSSASDAAKAIASVTDKALKVEKGENDNYSSSGRLIVMDRRTGTALWTAAARSGFRHNAICIGGGRIYCIDRASGAELSRRKRRGEELAIPPRLVAFDLKTGKEVWSTEEDVFGTWLSYSEEHGTLVEAGRNARDTLNDEPKGMRTYRGDDGSVLWSSKTLTGPAMIHHDTILLQGSACHLLTGKPRLREHPLSGELVEWTWTRNYGCNTPAASEHLLTFRSGAAGYFDLCSDGGTGNFGGFRSSCTNNLVVAGGVLCAPDYTRTCVCTYQNQTSLAMIHMPEVETWTSFGPQSPKHAVRRLGINLGAPGDRKADDGTLWLEYPSVGGASPAVPIKLEPEKPDWFRRHSSQISGDGPSWIAASGARGLRSLKVTLSDTDDLTRRYTVRLHFCEPDNVQPGDRRFAIRLQDKTVVPALDIVKEAGGRHRGLVKEFRGVLVDDDLLIELVPDAGAKLRAAVVSGIEIQSEGW